MISNSRAVAVRKLLTLANSNFVGTASASTAESQLRVCVVGSGPAGFYTANQLVKASHLHTILN